MTEIDKAEFAILADMALCIAVVAMAKSCSPEEVEAFFIANKDRLREQDFKDELIEKTCHKMQKSILSIQRELP